MSAPYILLAYLSPDTVLPLTSIVATIAGAAMLLTRGSIGFLVRCFRSALRRPRRVAGASGPHFESQRAMAADETRE
jgi:hypothetical protein